MSREGPSIARGALGVAADSTRDNNPQIRAYYELVRKKTGRSKKARVAVMRKLARMLYFMLKTGQNWKWQDPELIRAKIARLDSMGGGAS